jgi:predicted nucleic-acid-binding protein
MLRFAVDTNVLARALVDDESDQSRIARRFLMETPIFVPDSVLLETEWVLRSNLKLASATISELLVSLISTKNVSFENRRRVSDAVWAHRGGLDFADAMHLFAAGDCEAMITFDKTFIRRSGKIKGAILVRKP